MGKLKSLTQHELEAKLKHLKLREAKLEAAIALRQCPDCETDLIDLATALCERRDVERQLLFVEQSEKSSVVKRQSLETQVKLFEEAAAKNPTRKDQFQAKIDLAKSLLAKIEVSNKLDSLVALQEKSKCAILSAAKRVASKVADLDCAVDAFELFPSLSRFVRREELYG